ncbi:hypothetical protein D051_3673 [Vibrio parahaemolyticus VPCR-2010]|nr:hypothetical protein Vp2S01_1808 [Vibrio parahaemolyticus]EQM46666.1 hypothetical protein D051_3673 [Vibrio parahaemolyticus VPCR-2010]ETJ88414.1 hypothetical protein D029_2543 [Vibrio parahaemolyticus 970107]EXJ35064.1 hypothetical protein D050_1685 [Vibrio parahaemolyticus VPCR-2009]
MPLTRFIKAQSVVTIKIDRPLRAFQNGSHKKAKARYY